MVKEAGITSLHSADNRTIQVIFTLHNRDLFISIHGFPFRFTMIVVTRLNHSDASFHSIVLEITRCLTRLEFSIPSYSECHLLFIRHKTTNLVILILKIAAVAKRIRSGKHGCAFDIFRYLASNFACLVHTFITS